MASGAAQAAGGPTDQDILKDAETPGDILTYGMGTQGQRYSPLKAVNPDTVKKLAPVWAFSFGGEKQRGQETQPIVHDGTIYVTGSYSRLFAVDARTGEKKWQYDARLPEGILPCCDVVNRGAAIYGDKIYFGTLDAQLVALNKDTGKVVWSKKVADYQDGYSITAAPLIVNGKVITGNSGGEFGVVGAVKAYDAETGELVWNRPTVEGHMGTLDGKECTMTGDEERHLAGRSVEDRRRRHLARRHLRPGDQSAVLRHRQPGALEQPAAPRRQSLHLLDAGDQSGRRRDQVALPDHAA